MADLRTQPGSPGGLTVETPVSAPAHGPSARAVLTALDEAQRTAASATIGPTLLLAAAGTGKTVVLAHMLAHACASERLSPRRVLAVAASEGGCEQIRLMAERLLGAPLHGAWIGIIEHVCERVLRSHASALGRKPAFTLLDESAARTFVRKAAREIGADAEKWPTLRLAELIRALKAEGRAPPDGIIGDVYRAYERALADANAFDPDDVTRQVTRLLEEDESLRRKYRRRFDQVLVDDFHVLGPAHRRILELLFAPAGNVHATLDPELACPPAADGGERDFLASFPGARVFALATNYRSSGRILRAAERLIRHNPGPHFELMPARRRGARVVVLACGDEQEEALAIARWLRRLESRDHLRLSQAAVLVRNPILARPCEEAFVRVGLPYDVVSGQRFYERREVKDVLAYLALAIGRGDPAALARIANVPRRGIGPASVATIARITRQAGVSMAEAALSAASLPRVTAQRAGALADLGRLLGDLEDAARRLDAAGLIAFAVERSGYGLLIEELSRAEAEARREGIDELASMAKAFPGPAALTLPLLLERMTLDGKVSWLRRDDDDDDDLSGRPRQATEERVQVLTPLGSRGRQFQVVFMAGMDEGVFPAARALEAGAEGIQAERRLCYLGMTRARDRLVMSRAGARTSDGRVRACAPSRFLAELGRGARHFRIGGARALAPASPSTEREGAVLLTAREGQRVAHERYGQGEVVTVQGEGPRATVHVRFDSGLVKRLVLELSRMRPAPG